MIESPSMRTRALMRLLARFLTLALLWQSLPWSPPATPHLPPPPPVLGLQDIVRLTAPPVTYASVAALQKSGPSTVEQGQTIKYTLTITDDGSGTTNPHVYDVIDMRNIRDVSYSSDWWGTEHATPGQVTVEFYTDTMAAGEVATLTVVLEPYVPITDGTIITNELYYATWDPAGRLTGTTVVTTVINAPAYAMDGVASSEPACAGSTVTYTVWLTNVGHLATVQPFTITVELDGRVSFGGASHGGTESGGLVTWGNIATPLLPGDGISRTFWVTIPPSVARSSVLTYHLRATNPTEVTPDGTHTLTSTVKRVAADFADTAPGCVGTPITFTRIYTDMPVTAARWDFGDGTTITTTGGLTVTHTYAAGGYYTVTHTVTGTCDGVTQTHTYTAVAFIDGVAAAFEPGATVSVCVGGNVMFTATDAVSSSVVGHRWDFGDGTITDTLTLTTVEHTYTAGGYYTVTLTVTNATGCTAVFSRPNAVFVDTLAPAFAPTETITVCPGSMTTFTDTSAVGSRVVAHRWDMGDGTVITGTGGLTVAHAYLVGGYYTVTMVVTNATGCTDYAIRPRVVFVNGVRADFVATTPTSICTGSGVTFSSTSVASSTITYYRWDFDGVVSGSPTMSVTTHVYNSPGYHTVVLTVTSGGCQDTLVRTDYVFVSGLEANFAPTETITVCSGAATATLTDTSASSETIVARRWEWGDGSYTAAGSAPTATHTYTAPGYYTVTLIVTNATGCTDIVSRPNAVFVNGVRADVDTTPFSILCWSGPYCGYGTGCTITLQSTSVASGTIEEHLWDLGDGTVVSTGQTTTVTHIYTQGGEFTVTLTITSAGCSDTWISPYPIVIEKVATSFAPTQTVTVCTGALVYFTDTSHISGTVTSRVWDFGDGTTSPNLVNTPYVSHTYAAAGVYTVGLTLNTYSCSGVTRTAELVVVEDATAAFTNVLTACTGTAVPFTYTGQITGALGNYEWDWGDGTRDTTTMPTITHPYADPGVYTVRMTVTTSAGCAHVTTGTVAIEGAGVSFAPDVPQRLCLGAGVTFSDTSAISGTFKSRMWDFGDGITGTEAVTTHVYAATGSYTVTLTIETGSGCRTTITRTHWVTVESVTAAISPTDPLTVCIGQGLTLTDSSTSAGGGVVERHWDWGDGTTGNAVTMTHSFDHSGVFTVTLTVTTAAGCVDSDTLLVNVQGVTAGFEGPTALCYQAGGVTVTFTNTTAYSGALASWVWDFGGITATTWETATHVYTAPGVYTITLTVSTTNGCTSSYERTLEIDALTVSITRTPTTMICAGESVLLTDTSTVTGTVVSRRWDLGDGHVITGNLPSVSHIYDVGGNYIVTLAVTTAGGCTAWVTTTVDIDHITADFDAPHAVCLGSSAHFSDTSVAAGGIVSVEWELGDGSTSTSPVTDHIYTAPGVYTVWMTATSGSGCRRAVSKAITVEAVSAAIDPGASVTICERAEVRFADVSAVTGTLGAREWRFSDDGSTATGDAVTYTFDSAGTYLVSLALTTSAGCADVAAVVVTVKEPPAPTIEITPTSAMVGETVYFTDTGSGGSSWLWDFGDGAVAGPLSTPHATHAYGAPGTYTVTLTVTSAAGCTAGAQRSLTVNAVVESHVAYLPLVVRNYSIGPDLVVVDPIHVVMEDGPDYVLVTIRNDGAVPASGFWVDLYLDPSRPPEVGETWPELCSQGKAWFVRRTLAPGESYTLDTRWPDDPNSPGMRYSIWPDELPEGTHTLYAVVDSYWRPYGLVIESDESNNRSAPFQFVNLPNRPTSGNQVPTSAPTLPVGIATPQPPTTPVPRPTSPPTATPGP